MDKITKTNQTYSFLWEKIKHITFREKSHFDDIQEIIPNSIINGKIGIDIGSGHGRDTYRMASVDPLVKIISLDISDGIYKAKERASILKNVHFVKGSVLDIPVKENTFDFAYSFGVLHHIPNPDMGVKEIARVMKEGAYLYLYLYEDHSQNHIKYIAIKIITILRKVTIKIPHKLAYAISYLFSPLIVILFSYPAGILRKCKITRKISNGIPFNFGTHPFSLAPDVYDRFSAPIEHRFNRKAVFDLLNKNNFANIKIEKLETKAGWVAWACKNKC